MANIKSAKKRAVQNAKRQIINLARLTEIKTYTKKVLKALDENNIEEAKVLLRATEAKISRAKNKRVLKDNTAARKVSRLAKKVAAAEKKSA